MVQENIGIIATVNEFVDLNKPTFQLVSDPHDTFIVTHLSKRDARNTMDTRGTLE
jgi:hypothetical protein